MFINGKPAARINDPCQCADGPSHVGSGAPKVRINGRPAARVTDTTCHHGVITQGSGNVNVGNGGGSGPATPAGAMGTARQNAAPFVRP